MADNIKCKHCGEKRPALGYAPFPNEIGQKVGAEICQPCWADWLKKQSQIINHYGPTETTIGKLLHKLSFRRLSVRPQHPKSDPEVQASFRLRFLLS